MKITVYYEYSNVLEEKLIEQGFKRIESEDSIINTRIYIKENENYELIFTIKENIHNSLCCITKNESDDVNSILNFMFTKNSKFNSLELIFDKKTTIDFKEWNKQDKLPLYENKNIERLYFYNKENGIIVDEDAGNVNNFKKRYSYLKLIKK